MFVWENGRDFWETRLRFEQRHVAGGTRSGLDETAQTFIAKLDLADGKRSRRIRNGTWLVKPAGRG